MALMAPLRPLVDGLNGGLSGIFRQSPWHSGEAISTVRHPPKLRHIGQTLNAR